jgi:hypothetical protein
MGRPGGAVAVPTTLRIGKRPAAMPGQSRRDATIARAIRRIAMINVKMPSVVM